MHDAQTRPLKILLVEADPDQRSKVEGHLATSDDPVIEVESAGLLSDAMERLSEGGIDLVLLDLDLPDSVGLVTFERTYSFAPHVPIIVLTDADDEDTDLHAVKGGAQDYLPKDEVTGPLLRRSIRYSLERHRLVSALRSLSLMDDLTGLYNARGFSELGAQQLKLARRLGRRVLVLFVDLDRFKTINDTLGHHVGDRALLKVTDMMRATFRRSDLMARLGSDDFVVLALEASEDDEEMMTDRLRHRITSFNEQTKEPYQLSLSMGVSRFDPEDPVSLDELMDRAEAAMRDEKEAKRLTVKP